MAKQQNVRALRGRREAPFVVYDYLVAVANAETMPEDGELTGLLRALAALSKRIKLSVGDTQRYEMAPVTLRK